jgi:hypothetical protein
MNDIGWNKIILGEVRERTRLHRKMTLGEVHWVNRVALGEVCTMYIGFITRVFA